MSSPDRSHASDPYDPWDPYAVPYSDPVSKGTYSESYMCSVNNRAIIKPVSEQDVVLALLPTGNTFSTPS